ncbi:hypothetical protein [Microbulbifer sp. ALW1]|uniref:hypothetical protein n=1 Tax=Microbulbifer sp. (strain ALW1) TaxID=1516059 RepID=UPI001358DA3B|nr:hypothetical protein [Microbulbifer sp. ALW1]
MKTESYRSIAGMIFCPWILVAVWSLPYLSHSAFSKWVVINTFFAFTVFFFTAAVSHVILKTFCLTKGWHYPVVMFFVCLILYFGFSTFSASGYDELYHSQTQIVEDGNVTKAGYVLNFWNSVSGSLLSAGVFFVFWLIAVWKPRSAV